MLEESHFYFHKAQAADTRQVLILNTCDSSAAPYNIQKEIFRAELQRRIGEPIAFNEMNLDARDGEFKVRAEIFALVAFRCPS